VRKIGDEPVYEVFARRVDGEPLRHIGSVAAPDDTLARVYARSIYDEETWITMCIVPRHAVISVESTRTEAVDAYV
jgi:1,2-phenylacetyl-CoA epoxidase PaaB subunit